MEPSSPNLELGIVSPKSQKERLAEELHKVYTEYVMVFEDNDWARFAQKHPRSGNRDKSFVETMVKERKRIITRLEKVIYFTISSERQVGLTTKLKMAQNPDDTTTDYLLIGMSMERLMERAETVQLHLKLKVVHFLSYSCRKNFGKMEQFYMTNLQ